ncbi:MAG: hypothetical protein R3231_00175 [bacterium]|nr:hypothetical protein [bacterium]
MARRSHGFFMLALSLLLFGCGGGSSSSGAAQGGETIALSGSVGDDFTVVRAPTLLDKIYAFSPGTRSLPWAPTWTRSGRCPRPTDK